jgi:N-acetylmuramoyl-L-alanine amidase
MFSDLAKKYGVSVNAIKSANPNLNPNRLKIGDKVIIPPATVRPDSTAAGSRNGGAGEGTVYRVKSGDTLTKIGREYGVSVKELRSANNLKTDQIKVGQRLKIPVKSAPSEPAPVPAAVPFTPPSGFPPGSP